ncbi:MAG TPA: sugar phosphate isomerase/epimerase family protein [Clostridia bacterium]|nr:sugar phosphate isomerase/epimerase family protein [Clostridia bacterium]
MQRVWLSGFGDEIDARLETQMEHMAGLGIRAVELRGVDGKNIADLTLEEAKDVRARMRELGFRASALGSPIGKSDIKGDFQPVLDSFRHVVDLARAIEAPAIRMFSFFVPQDNPDAWRGEVLDRLATLKSAAKGSGVRLLHENERMIYGDDAARCADLAQALCDGDFGLIFDPSNYVQCGVDPWAAWQALKPYVAYLHIKDSVRLAAGADEHSDNPHRVAGDGEARIRDILEDLKRIGFTGYLSVEPHLKSSAHVPGTAPEKWAAAAIALENLLDECGIAWREE